MTPKVQTADKGTLRRIWAAIGAKFRALIPARNTPDGSEEILGEQIVLPQAFVKETAVPTRKDHCG